jgi:hypothetical protein
MLFGRVLFPCSALHWDMELCALPSHLSPSLRLTRDHCVMCIAVGDWGSQLFNCISAAWSVLLELSRSAFVFSPAGVLSSPHERSTVKQRYIIVRTGNSCSPDLRPKSVTAGSDSSNSSGCGGCHSAVCTPASDVSLSAHVITTPNRTAAREPAKTSATSSASL